jgi:hypothetical protein
MFLGRQRGARSAKGISSFRRPIVAQRRHQAFRSALLRVAPFSLLLVFVACGATLPVTHRPASELRLEIIIGDQYSEKTNVSVSVHVHDEKNQREVALADNTGVTCNGTDISVNAKSIPFIRQNPIFVLGFCPRQPPGGSYKIAYTDEHGASTTAAVPVPSGSFSFLSPLPGWLVPIPTDSSLSVRVSLPTPPPGGTVAVDGVWVTCGAYPNACGELFWGGLQNEATPTTTATPTVFATLPPVGNPTPSPPPAPTATISQDGDKATITLLGDYSLFGPNSGRIVVDTHERMTPDPGGFSAATAVYVESLTADITWVR